MKQKSETKNPQDFRLYNYLDHKKIKSISVEKIFMFVAWSNVKFSCKFNKKVTNLKSHLSFTSWNKYILSKIKSINENFTLNHDCLNIRWNFDMFTIFCSGVNQHYPNMILLDMPSARWWKDTANTIAHIQVSIISHQVRKVQNSSLAWYKISNYLNVKSIQHRKCRLILSNQDHLNLMVFQNFRPHIWGYE